MSAFCKFKNRLYGGTLLGIGSWEVTELIGDRTAEVNFDTVNVAMSTIGITYSPMCFVNV